MCCIGSAPICACTVRSALGTSAVTDTSRFALAQGSVGPEARVFLPAVVLGVRSLPLVAARADPTSPHYVFSQRVGPNRWQFLLVAAPPHVSIRSDASRLDSMQDLSKSISKVNPKSKLFVVRGPPATMLPALFKQWGITDIVWYVRRFSPTRHFLASDLC